MKKLRSTVCGFAFVWAFAGGMIYDIGSSKSQMAMRVFPRYGMELSCDNYGHTQRPGLCRDWRENYEEWGGKVYPKPGCRYMNRDDCDNFYGLNDRFLGMDEYYYGE